MKKLKALTRLPFSNWRPWLLVVFFFLSLPAQLFALPEGFQLELIQDNLPAISNIAVARDGRVWLNELKTGNIRLMDSGVLQEAPFFHLEVDSLGERGLLGLALHPEFPEQPWLYVTFTDPIGPTNRLIRIDASGNAGSQRENLLALPANAQLSLHNGGEIHFGPDAKLYLMMGDNYDLANPQNLSTLAGKMLRLESDGSPAAGNPWSGGSGAARFVYSLGHRNSFGFAFDPVSGALIQTENGQRDADEINWIQPGLNYGWPTCEGACQPPDNRFEDPLWQTFPTIGPTGLAFLSPRHFPEPWAGDAIFGDFNRGRLSRMRFAKDNPGVPLEVSSTFLLPSEWPALQDAGHPGILDVSSAPDGSLWISAVDFRDFINPTGAIFRLSAPQTLFSTGRVGSEQLFVLGCLLLGCLRLLYSKRRFQA